MFDLILNQQAASYNLSPGTSRTLNCLYMHARSLSLSLFRRGGGGIIEGRPRLFFFSFFFITLGKRVYSEKKKYALWSVSHSSCAISRRRRQRYVFLLLRLLRASAGIYCFTSVFPMAGGGRDLILASFISYILGAFDSKTYASSFFFSSLFFFFF